MINYKFSIIMAAYNAEKYIEASIKSVLNQNYDNWELIIIDDGSVDATPEIVDLYANKYDKVKVVHQNNSGTAAAARNVALKYVVGDFVQMLDADDLFEYDLLFKLNAKINEITADIYVPNCKCFDEDRMVWEKISAINSYDKSISGADAFSLSLYWKIHGIFCVKTNLIKRIGYDNELINGDEFTTRKLLINAENVAFVDSYYYYRLNENSTTRSKKNMIRMFECLITDWNIFEYAVDKGISINSIRCAYKKLIWSLATHQLKAERLRKEVTKDEYLKIDNIISSVYYKIKQTKNVYKKHTLYHILYLISIGSFNRYKFLIRIISKIKKG